VLIACGGLYDLFTPQLPENLRSICAGNAAAERLVANFYARWAARWSQLE
jgi:hypothetical protein